MLGFMFNLLIKVEKIAGKLSMNEKIPGKRSIKEKKLESYL